MRQNTCQGTLATITLITDFGLQHGHVGAMKGVIRSIASNTEIADISHHIPPQDIRHAGFEECSRVGRGDE